MAKKFNVTGLCIPTEHYMANVIQAKKLGERLGRSGRKVYFLDEGVVFKKIFQQVFFLNSFSYICIVSTKRFLTLLTI
jgi:hypothetical protein